MMLAAAVGPGWSMLFWTVTLFGITDVIARHVVEPMLWKHSTGLSPLAVIVAAIFWSWIWGPIGFVFVHAAHALPAGSRASCGPARIS
jgi:predicted PurR-regulated permease PerM